MTARVGRPGPLRRLLIGGALIVALAPAAGVAAPADDPAPPPSQWPASPLVEPRVEGAAHAIRFWGPDRYQTSLALALGLRGTGEFPFDSPDRSSGGAPSLSAASGWWGVGACPRSVIVVAGDTPADALAASALSDPTDESSEPFLQRSAAADPLFDPIGGFARVDTDSAPILVTRSTRQGATALTPATRRAAMDLRSGGCTTARQAIVVGGTSAVPAAVDEELVSIGYDQVFRVDGANRHETAAAVARSLGTAPVPPDVDACDDPTVDDGDARMSFYANSVIEYRESAGACEVLGRTVVLADGVTGADALAAGWWTSFWQVPVLLHNGSDVLAPATAEAMATLDIDHVVVLGGPARISDAVVDQVVDLTDARVLRVAGPNRYATSVEMAQVFGGWWPTGRGTEFTGSMVCLAASSGDGAEARGWPDALSAGPWCGAANGAASDATPPNRALAPTAGGSPIATDSLTVTRGHQSTPILLVPFGAEVLPDAVSSFLTGAFDPADDWCTSVAASDGCLVPGFVVAFGGTTAVGDPALAQASTLVSGGSALESGLAPPSLSPPFHTSLDLGPVYQMAGAGTSAICASRGGYQLARWLAVFGDAGVDRPLAQADVMIDGRYVTDGDGVERSRGTGAPVCVAYVPGGADLVAVRAIGLAGRASGTVAFSIEPAGRVAMLDPVTVTGPSAAGGPDSDTDESDGGTTTRTFAITDPLLGVGIDVGGTPTTVTTATLEVALTRGTDTGSSSGPDVFSATWTLTTPLGTITGTAAGEALHAAGVWELRGSTAFEGGSWGFGSGRGGFSATWATNTAGDADDDAISWQFDGLLGSTG